MGAISVVPSFALMHDDSASYDFISKVLRKLVLNRNRSSRHLAQLTKVIDLHT